VIPANSKATPIVHRLALSPGHASLLDLLKASAFDEGLRLKPSRVSETLRSFGATMLEPVRVRLALLPRSLVRFAREAKIDDFGHDQDPSFNSRDVPNIDWKRLA
jgi:hypothetical protein